MFKKLFGIGKKAEVGVQKNTTTDWTEAFIPSVRGHIGLVSIDANFQIVRCFAAGLEFHYTNTIEAAEEIATELRNRGPHGPQENGNTVTVEIKKWGEFVPHYEYDKAIA